MNAKALINAIVKNGESGISLWLLRDEIKDFIEKQDEIITQAKLATVDACDKCSDKECMKCNLHVLKELLTT